MSRLRREIKEMKQARDTQRSRRLLSDVPSIAIVGYTNAGKSSLLNAPDGSRCPGAERVVRHARTDDAARRVR